MGDFSSRRRTRSRTPSSAARPLRTLSVLALVALVLGSGAVGSVAANPLVTAAEGLANQAAMNVPYSSGAWGNGMHREPNHEADSDYFMWATAPGEGWEHRYRVYLDSYMVQTSLPDSSLASMGNPGATYRIVAFFGVWSDCNQDGFMGNVGQLVYSSTLLMSESVCPSVSGSSYPMGAHNYNGIVNELLWLTPENRGEPGESVGSPDNQLWTKLGGPYGDDHTDGTHPTIRMLSEATGQELVSAPAPADRIPLTYHRSSSPRELGMVTGASPTHGPFAGLCSSTTGCSGWWSTPFVLDPDVQPGVTPGNPTTIDYTAGRAFDVTTFGHVGRAVWDAGFRLPGGTGYDGNYDEEEDARPYHLRDTDMVGGIRRSGQYQTPGAPPVEPFLPMVELGTCPFVYADNDWGFGWGGGDEVILGFPTLNGYDIGVGTDETQNCSGMDEGDWQLVNVTFPSLTPNYESPVNTYPLLPPTVHPNVTQNPTRWVNDTLEWDRNIAQVKVDALPPFVDRRSAILADWARQSAGDATEFLVGVDPEDWDPATFVDLTDVTSLTWVYPGPPGGGIGDGATADTEPGEPSSQVGDHVVLLHGRREWNLNPWQSVHDYLQNRGVSRSFLGYYGQECADLMVVNYANHHPSLASRHHKHYGGSAEHGRPVTVDTNCSAHMADSSMHNENTDIRHIGYHVAWALYDTYTERGQTIDVVSFSMGGLIIRYALGMVGYENQEIAAGRMQAGQRQFPPELLVEDVVSISGPHYIDNSACRDAAAAAMNDGQADGWLGWENLAWDMWQICNGGGFQDWLRTIGNNPQGASGTDWTLIASDCDDAARPNFALTPAAAHKVWYGAPIDGGKSCWDHVGQDAFWHADSCVDADDDFVLGSQYRGWGQEPGIIWNAAPRLCEWTFQALIWNTW